MDPQKQGSGPAPKSFRKAAAMLLKEFERFFVKNPSNTLKTFALFATPLQKKKIFEDLGEVLQKRSPKYVKICSENPKADH